MLIVKIIVSVILLVIFFLGMFNMPMRAKNKGKLKTRKWYSADITPDRKYGLIIMTDMGYIFEALYEDGVFKTSCIENDKVYFRDEQLTVLKWMKF